MEAIIYQKEQSKRTASLWQSITCLCPSLAQAEGPQVIAVTGAGGKTTCIMRLAEELVAAGKRVLVVTTTHMYKPESHGVLSNDPAVITAALERDGLVIAGLPYGKDKIAYIGDAAYEAVCPAAQVVLVEADGARRQPFKIPRPLEPVLPETCDAVLCVAGLSALGKPLKSSCYGWSESGTAGHDLSEGNR